ncbi:MAG TPA: energy transducer TonB [Vicinamibacterales bacterium]|nr:energy transducer TonB [Vicinamibacterales bacterium]
MSLSRTTRRLSIALVLWMTVAAATASAQDSLARAKDFYAAAAYEEALTVLQRLNANPATEKNEVAAYQVFCLVALGRSDEAKRTIESLVRTDPLYKLSDSQASPKVRAFFEDVRRPLLPEIVKQTYGRAKDAYDRKEHETATAEFDRTIALIDEIGAAGDRALADLKTLAGGFRDLSKASAKPAPPPAPVPPPATEGTGAGSNGTNGNGATGTPAGVTATPSPVPTTPRTGPAVPETEPTFGLRDNDVQRPVALKRPMPEWRPTAVEAMIEFRGSLELLIGADGRVISAAVTDSVHPQYDKVLKQAAEGWTFKPATKNGKPVRYRYAMDIQLKK